MALNPEQNKILTEAREKLKVMKQIPKLEKEISSLRKKLEIKESKLSDLINILDYQDLENGKPDDNSDLF